MTTILYPGRDAEVAGAVVDGGDLWVPVDELDPATGWHLEAQGLCQGDVCVPVPAGQGASWQRDESFNVSAFARHLGQAQAHDDGHDVWVFGPPSGDPPLLSGEAPDFTLPDIDGDRHALSEYRGKKVLLLSWASW